MAVSQDNGGIAKGVQDRLLDVAEGLFCEHGFNGTSIREIAAAAGCNIASVNYYFGSKDNLYIEVWRRHLIPMRNARIASIESITSQSRDKIKLEDLLRSFAQTFVSPQIDTSSISRLSKLMAREWIDRHLPSRIFLDEFVKPTEMVLRKALMQVCPYLDESKIVLMLFSVAGQLVHLVHVKTMLEGSNEKLDLELPDYNEILEHIIKFSVAGIGAYNEGKTQ
jgi:AcrR family transcriptional regulator